MLERHSLVTGNVFIRIKHDSIIVMISQKTMVVEPCFYVSNRLPWLMNLMASEYTSINKKLHAGSDDEICLRQLILGNLRKHNKTGLVFRSVHTPKWRPWPSRSTNMTSDMLVIIIYACYTSQPGCRLHWILPHQFFANYVDYWR